MSAPPSRPPSPHASTSFLAAVGGADLWRIDLDLPADAAALVLSPAERERALRLVSDRDRRRFVAGRAALRRVLAAYVGGRPEALGFLEGVHGKPALSGGPHFSLSRSGPLALCAVSRACEVGVDVEALREVPEAADIAALFFAPADRAAWLAEGGGGGRAFLRAWTRTEALLKALGVGIGGDRPGAEAASSIEVVDLDLLPAHAAALALARR